MPWIEKGHVCFASLEMLCFLKINTSFKVIGILHLLQYPSFLVFPTITRFNPVYVYKRRRLEREPPQGAPSDVTIPTLVPPNTPPDTPPVAPFEAPLHQPTRPSKPPDQFGLTHRLYLTIFHLLRFLTLTHR